MKREVRKHGNEQADWLVGWCDIFGKRRSKRFGSGNENKKLAADFAAKVDCATRSMQFVDDLPEPHDCIYEISADEAKAITGDVIYFVEAVGLERIKIGMTNRLHSRLVSLQMYCPVRIRLLATLPGGSNEEAALHREFMSANLHGEWFQLNSKLRKFISKVRASTPLELRQNGQKLDAKPVPTMSRPTAGRTMQKTPAPVAQLDRASDF